MLKSFVSAVFEADEELQRLSFRVSRCRLSKETCETCQEHLWDRFELIWGSRISPSRKMLEAREDFFGFFSPTLNRQGFVCCMRERAQLERQYARCGA